MLLIAYLELPLLVRSLLGKGHRKLEDLDRLVVGNAVVVLVGL